MVINWYLGENNIEWDVWFESEKNDFEVEKEEEQ